jgi:hypothetical protein
MKILIFLLSSYKYPTCSPIMNMNLTHMYYGALENFGIISKHLKIKLVTKTCDCPSLPCFHLNPNMQSITFHYMIHGHSWCNELKNDDNHVCQMMKF